MNLSVLIWRLIISFPSHPLGSKSKFFFTPITVSVYLGIHVYHPTFTTTLHLRIGIP